MFHISFTLLSHFFHTCGVPAGGALSGKYLSGDAPPGSRFDLFADRYARFNSPRVKRAVEQYVRIAKEAGVPPEQLAYAFCRSGGEGEDREREGKKMSYAVPKNMTQGASWPYCVKRYGSGSLSRRGGKGERRTLERGSKKGERNMFIGVK